MTHILESLRAVAPIAHFTIWPTQDARGAELSTPPIIAWRYHQPTKQLAEFLRQAIMRFQGLIEWEVLVKGERWILLPARIRQYEERQGCNGLLLAAAELQVTEPDFGIRANAESRLLAEHIRQELRMATGIQDDAR
jgi:hypothetical protein